jgi:hypothetical protein
MSEQESLLRDLLREQKMTNNFLFKIMQLLEKFDRERKP